MQGFISILRENILQSEECTGNLKLFMQKEQLYALLKCLKLTDLTDLYEFFCDGRDETNEENSSNNLGTE